MPKLAKSHSEFSLSPASRMSFAISACAFAAAGIGTVVNHWLTGWMAVGGMAGVGRGDAGPDTKWLVLRPGPAQHAPKRKPRLPPPLRAPPPKLGVHRSSRPVARQLARLEGQEVAGCAPSLRNHRP